MKLYVLINLLCSSFLWTDVEEVPAGLVPCTLAGRNLTSHFYHYHNNYYFNSDSSGYSEDGQLAWSSPVDTIALGISGNKILYGESERFSYSICDTTLTISYFTPNDTNDARVFHYRSQYDDWMSAYEYSYGKECLRQRERIEEFSAE